MTTKILIKRRLNAGIYKSLGGGETVTLCEWRYGPRNLVKAYDTLAEIREESTRNYGNVGCGYSWIETSDGRKLDGFGDHDPRLPHAERVEHLEASLLTAAEIAEMERDMNEHPGSDER